MNAYKHAKLAVCLSMTFIVLTITPSNADQITIPWTVDLTLPAISTIPPFEGAYNVVDFSPPIGPDRMGMTLTTQQEHSYMLHLPFNVTISAPEQASPGQHVALESSAVLAGPPSFTTVGSTNFNTAVFAGSNTNPSSFSIGIPGVTDTISYGGVSLTVAGDRSYTSTDNSADPKLTRTIWKNDPYGNPLNMPIATQFQGYQMQTSGDLDAWGGSIKLLQFASNFIPPPVGTAAAVVSSIMDLKVGPQLDIIENTYLTTQFVTGYYTDDGGKTYDNFLTNGATSKAVVTIPDTLTPGSKYDIQMTALGLGFSTLFDYLLQGNVDIELEVLSGLYNVDIADIPLGSSFLVDSWVDRFQIVNFMNPDFGGFLTAEQFNNAFLSFDIVGGLADQDPTKTAPPLELAKDDTLIQHMIDTNADPNQQSYEFPGSPPSATVSVSAVPEPSMMLLMGYALLSLAGLRRWSSK